MLEIERVTQDQRNQQSRADERDEYAIKANWLEGAGFHGMVRALDGKAGAPGPPFGLELPAGPRNHDERDQGRERQHQLRVTELEPGHPCPPIGSASESRTH